jgi:hypothetical protein
MAPPTAVNTLELDSQRYDPISPVTVSTVDGDARSFSETGDDEWMSTPVSAKTQRRRGKSGRAVTIVVSPQLRAAQRTIRRLQSMRSESSGLFLLGDGDEAEDRGRTMQMAVTGMVVGEGEDLDGTMLVEGGATARDATKTKSDGESAEEMMFDEAFEEAALRKGEDLELEVDDEDLEEAGSLQRRNDGQSLLYGLERCVWYFQALAVTLSLPVAWGPTTRHYAGYLRHTLDYAVYWLHALAEWLDFSNVLFFWDLIAYGILLLVPPLLIFLLFSFWAIPDYTDSAYTRQWLDTYVFNWWALPCGTFVRSVLAFMVGVAATLAGMFLLRTYVGQNVDVIFGSAAGGFLLGCWLVYLVCIAIIRRCAHTMTQALLRLHAHSLTHSTTLEHNHRDVLNSTKGVPLVAADGIIKGIVATKVRVMLMLIMVTYVPTVLHILRALVPLFDWNDTFTTPHRRDMNFHLPCYFMAFPPSFDAATNQTRPVVRCDSTLGIALHSTSGVALLLLVVGLQALVYYLVWSVFGAFRQTDWYDNFEFFNTVYRNYLERLKGFPKYRVRVEETRLALTEAYATCKQALQASTAVKAAGEMKKQLVPRWLRQTLKAKAKRAASVKGNSMLGRTTSRRSTFASFTSRVVGGGKRRCCRVREGAREDAGVQALRLLTCSVNCSQIFKYRNVRMGGKWDLDPLRDRVGELKRSISALSGTSQGRSRRRLDATRRQQLKKGQSRTLRDVLTSPLGRGGRQTLVYQYK